MTKKYKKMVKILEQTLPLTSSSTEKRSIHKDINKYTTEIKLIHKLEAKKNKSKKKKKNTK